MKTTIKITEKEVNYQYDNFTNYLIPFGSSDIRKAVEIALEVGESGEWAAEQVQEFAESCGVNIDKCDPVSCVYDAILQEARTEIEEKTNFDFCNDGTDIWTSGNYVAPSYDWSNDSPEIIKEKLQENDIIFESLSLKTQWFLEQIYAEY